MPEARGREDGAAGRSRGTAATIGFVSSAWPIAILLVFASGCSSTHTSAGSRQVIVLGVDGMDPGFVEMHWDALPNLDWLRRTGGFRRLRTTTPPQSPVAWSTFITGMDPAGHGIFDFVHRDPNTLQPFSSMSKTEEPRHSLPLGPYSFPLSQARVETLRKGTAFWRILADRNIPVTVLRMPTNYPPLEVGEALAGMGTPDLRGTQGTFTFYTDDPAEVTHAVAGGRVVKLPLFENRAVLTVEGPPNPLRKDRRYATVDLVVDVDPDQPVARLKLGDSTMVMREGEWSGWLSAKFPLFAGAVSTNGMFRVYVRRLHPTLEVYVSPVNLDPRDPALPISFPNSYSRRIADEIGPFYTQGIAEDTSALRQGALDLREFLAQSRLVLDDERRLLYYALRHYRDGLLFFYISAIDQNSHILWGKHEAELLEIYRAVDGMIGEVMRRVPGADLIVMSDHGFTSFDRAVHLNTWLWKKGFLHLNGPPGEGDEPFAHVDWKRTEAYALGLNGLYLNLAGREKQGVVKKGPESRAILARIAAEMTAFRDPENGRQVVEAAHPLAGSTQSPDMIVGYGRGYRGSWQTALGGIPAELIEDNHDAWGGDHCINAADVPGVLLSNRQLQDPDPGLKDVTVSIMKLFGVAADPGMTGKAVIEVLR